MYELATWIDKSLEMISKKDLFKSYFLFVEMEDIEGTYFLTNRARGIDITLSNELLVEAIHLTNNYLDYNTFQDELPFYLKFDLSRNETRKILGEANSTGGGYESILIDYILPWDKYFFKSYSLHIAYSKDESRIEQITLGSLKFEEDALPE